MDYIEVDVYGLYRHLHLFEDDYAQELRKLADSLNGKKLYTIEDIAKLCQSLEETYEFTYCLTNGGTTLEILLV